MPRRAAVSWKRARTVLAPFGESPRDVETIDEFEAGSSCGHRDRFLLERQSVPDPAEGLHDIRRARDQGERHAVRQRFAETDEIRVDAMDLLNSALREPEAGHDLVEDQHRSGGIRELTGREQK